jgi:hypothetical protein
MQTTVLGFIGFTRDPTTLLIGLITILIGTLKDFHLTGALDGIGLIIILIVIMGGTILTIIILGIIIIQPTGIITIRIKHLGKPTLIMDIGLLPIGQTILITLHTISTLKGQRLGLTEFI